MFEVFWDTELPVLHIHGFTAKSAGERVLKIGQHLTKRERTSRVRVKSPSYTRPQDICFMLSVGLSTNT